MVLTCLYEDKVSARVVKFEGVVINLVSERVVKFKVVLINTCVNVRGPGLGMGCQG